MKADDQREILLSARPFWGESVIARSQNPELLERFRDAGAILALLRAAAQAGARGLVTTNDPRVLGALQRLGEKGLPVYPVIPNVIGYVRESTHSGLLGAGWRRLRSLRAADLARVGMTGLVRAPKVLSRHFPSILEVLLEVEMADFRPFRPRAVYLHPMTTDLALAFGHRPLLELFRRRMTERFGCEAGLATHNFGRLLPQLREWNLRFDRFLAPFNDRGWGMLPSQDRCEELLRESPEAAVAADRVAVGGLPGAEQFRYLRGAGVRAGVVDVASVKELEGVMATAGEFVQ